MSWWSFEAGKKYPLGDVVDEIHTHIREAKKIRNRPDKRRLLKVIENCGHPVIIYSPQNTGWGVSPMNPNCWKTDKGEPIIKDCSSI